MKVNYGDGNDNEEFLANFPKVAAYPHLFVVDSSGNVVHSQGTGELEEGNGYDEEVFLAFLNEYRPK